MRYDVTVRWRRALGMGLAGVLAAGALGAGGCLQDPVDLGDPQSRGSGENGATGPDAQDVSLGGGEDVPDPQDVSPEPDPQDVSLEPDPQDVSLDDRKDIPDPQDVSLPPDPQDVAAPGDVPIPQDISADPACAFVAPESLVFGATAVGDTAVGMVTVSACGALPITVQVSVSGDGFALLGGDTITLAPGAAVALQVSFAPAASGSFGGALTLVVMGGGQARTISVPLSGTGS